MIKYKSKLFEGNKNMKTNFKSKKFIIPITIIVIALIVASALGYSYYQEQELQKKLETAFTEIEKKETEFNKHDAREDKFAILQAILKEHTDYEESKDVIKEIDEKYHSTISNMQKFFIDEYNKTLSDNTLNDVDKINDIECLSNSIRELSELLQIIQNEKDIVCTENKLNEYEKRITDLVKVYEARVTAIEQKENEKNAASDNSSNSNASNGNYSNNSGNNGPVLGTPNSWGNYYDENGNFVSGWQSDENGNRTHHDANGNTWTDDELKEWFD